MEGTCLFLKVLFCLLGAGIAALLLYLLFLVICVLFIDPNKVYYQQNALYCALKDSLAYLILFFSHVTVKAEGTEKVPEGELFLLVSNHISGYDPLAAMVALKKYNLIFVSKPENLKIPVAGRLAKRCCFRPIDRENPRNALSDIQDCVKLLKLGTGPVVIYPEGTRSRTGELLPFHNSVFKIAQEAHVPVVVMVTSGTEHITKNAPWRKTEVTLRILDVLSADHIHDTRTSIIGEEVRTMMLNSRDTD